MITLQTVRGVAALNLIGTATFIAQHTGHPWIVAIGAVVAWFVWPDPSQVTVVKHVAHLQAPDGSPVTVTAEHGDRSVVMPEPWMLVFRGGSVFIECEGKVVKNQMNLRGILGAESVVGNPAGFDALSALLRVGQSTVDEHNRAIGYPRVEPTS